MLFKLNDYDAFLSSLYEEKPHIKKEQSSDDFPVDFDFGLAMSTENTPAKFTNTNTEFIAETGAFGLTNDALPQGLSRLQLQESETILQTGLPTYAMQHGQFKANPIIQQSPRPYPVESYSCSQFFPPNADIKDRKFEASLAEAHARPRTKSSHNIIEQRYRNKINENFSVLQNTVPSLRATRRKLKGSTPPDMNNDYGKDLLHDYSDLEEDDLEGLEPARKLNKGTILTKSIEYIHFLEMKNNSMLNENEELIMKAKMLGIPIDESLQC